MQPADSNKNSRIELILRQVESLPTLPSVATRLLSLTAAADTNASQIVEVVNSDPALTGKVLGLCRRANKAVRNDSITIDRAVVLLGFNAIRNAVLSVKVLEMFAPMSSDAEGDVEEAQCFDRIGFWQHSLAVAIMAELLATEAGDEKKLPPDEAFVCGLLHDIGKLALDYVLPKSLARIVELTDLNQGNIAEFERRIVGMDHHTIGKRLAEQWQLPHRLQDCIWLHGSPHETLPKLAHQRLVKLVGLADLLVRRHHIGYSGNHMVNQDADELALAVELDPKSISDLLPKLYEELEHRSELMGLKSIPSRKMFMASIQEANVALGQLNSALDRRSRKASRQSRILDAISSFHAVAAPGRSVQDVLNSVAGSATLALGTGFHAILYQPERGDANGRTWLVCQYGDQSAPVRADMVEPPPHAPDLRSLDPREPAVLDLINVLPWITDFLLDAPDMRQVRLLPLACGWGTAAVLLHDHDPMPPWEELSALTNAWGGSIAAAAQHEGARRLGEDLAEANIALAQAQDRLLHTETMAHLGEMAAGAAHEMNNPLTVICGRAQLLATTLPANTKQRHAAQTIVEQTHRLSDLITSLKLFADPPQPRRLPTNVGRMLQDSVDRVRSQLSEQEARVLVSLRIQDDVSPELNLDGEQVSQAVVELLLNAVQAKPKTAVTLGAHVDAGRQLLVITVTDDGIGMDGDIMAHAMDPFFSAKAAGRRVGMGLTRARQFAAGHDGGIELRGVPGCGTTATLTIGLDLTDTLADTSTGRPVGGSDPRRGKELVGDAGGRIAASTPPQVGLSKGQDIAG